MKNDVTGDLNEIGDMLASIASMADIRAQICDLGGKVIAVENDDLLVKCDDSKAASRRLRGRIANVIVNEIDDSTIFLRRMRKC